MEQNIPLDHISPNPQQPRKVFNPDDIASLAASMQAADQVLNITVEPDPANFGHYLLIDGERRWRAAKIARWAVIRATILPPSSNGHASQSRLIKAMAANLQRADLNPIEEAHAYQEMLDMGMNKAEICRSLGIYQMRINYRLAWLALDLKIQNLVAAGRIPSDHRIAEAIASLPPAEQISFAQGIANRPGLTIPAIVNAAARLAEKLAAGQSARAAGSPAIRRVAETANAYNALAAVHKVPPYPYFKSAVEKTCKACALFDVASESNCRDCPLVVHINNLTGE